MNRSFFYKNFSTWLKINRSRFLFSPYIVNVKRNSFYIQFHGLGNILYAHVLKRGDFSIWTNLIAAKSQHPWDWVGDFDIIEKKTSAGYQCDLCTQTKYFKNRNELYSQHSYEFFLEWCNEKLIPSHFIINVGRPKEGGCSKFCTKEDLESFKEAELIDVFEIPHRKKQEGIDVN
jgi:hypothetical protein